MPVNRKFPIAVLMDACRDFAERTSRRVSFEYILIAGVNAGAGAGAAAGGPVEEALGLNLAT